MSDTASARYSAQDLLEFATALLAKNGLSHERADIVAEILLEADLMGHTTHGLHLLAPYLKELETGMMTKEGEPIVTVDRGSTLAIDGCYLPGPWLIVKALDIAFERIQAHSVITIVIQHSHHIGCLAAYAKRATDKGLFMLLACSDPNERAVAPYGGIRPVYSPDPLAAGIPTQGEPIILDISMSATAMGLLGRMNQQGQRLSHPWLMDNEGNLSDDPGVFCTDPRGSILPLGGTDLGYKGFALGILIEALTAALSGQGRSNPPQRWGASVFLQVIDPQGFGGLDFFIQETQWLAEACRKNPTKPGDPPVRLPGSRALQNRKEQMQKGVALYPTILPALQPWAKKLGVPLPPSTP
jgi:L-lactate dehydrogenase